MMRASAGVGRIIGVLLLLQLAAGLLVNFVLMAPVLANPPGYLVNAAAHPLQVGLSVLIGLATGALAVGIAIAAWPVGRQHSQTMALWLLALAVVSFSLLAVENAAVLSMLSLSQACARADTASAGLFPTLAAVVGSARNWAHYTHLIVVGCMYFVLYGLLYRFALVPRGLAAFGLLAVMLQVSAVTMPLFGQPIVFLMLLPLGLSHLALALWLVAEGFAPTPPGVPTDGPSPGMS
jgi:hypothetical protein